MHLVFYEYSIPFKKPFVTSGQTFTARNGIMIQLQNNFGSALGEAAPLPGFSSETTSQVIQQIRAHIKPIEHFFNHTFSLSDLKEFLGKQSLSPSLQFCLYTLGTFALAMQRKQSLQQILFINPADSIAINAVIDLAQQNVVPTAATYHRKGFKTIKLKAGADIQRLTVQLRRLRKAFPKINIRIDANQSWSLEQALTIFKQLEPLEIEYFEEPLANPRADTLHELKSNTAIPIALDESLAQTFSLPEAAAIADVLVIKPMVHGLCMDTLQKISRREKIKLVFTTSLEAGVGQLMTATLASGLGAPDAAHGLATGHLLEQNLRQINHFINNGRFTLPDYTKLTALTESWNTLSGITLTKLNIK